MTTHLPKKCFAVIAIVLTFAIAFPVYIEGQERTELKIPDIPDFYTLKCDFHMHTLFSDGMVWPTVRVFEIWQRGLDAMAITDHIEIHGYEKDIKTDHNRPYEIALPYARSVGVLIIKGAEITKSMPPGHLNAIFIEDANPLEKDNFLDAINGAVDQGAFVFWNHPGSGRPGNTVWHPEHAEIYEKGWMHGIEVVNRNNYYYKAHKLALEKKLTMLGNSDMHYPLDLALETQDLKHRSMTLVFAKEKSVAAIKEALFERRTAVYCGNMLIGEEKFLNPIFSESIELLNPDLEIRGRSRAYLHLKNSSDISYELVITSEPEELEIPEKITLKANKTILLAIRGKPETASGEKEVTLRYKVNNLLIAPEESLPVEFNVNITFVENEQQ